MRPSPPPSSGSASFTAQPSHGPPELPSVEVVTLLGDSVVGVAHLEPAGRAPSRRRGQVALALGALLLVLAALTFARGLAAAAEDARALAHWRDVLGRPVHEFRPIRLHPIHDWMAALGLAGGLAAITWGTARLRARAPRDTFTVGSEPGVDAGLSGPCPPRLELVRWDGAGALVRVPAGMRARMHRDGQSYDTGQLAALGLVRAGLAGAPELAVPPSGSVRVDMTTGPVAFVIRMVAASRARTLSGHRLPERRTLAFGLGSLLGHAALLALVSAIPPEARSMELTLFGPGPRAVRAAWKPAEEPPVDPPGEVDPNGGALGASMRTPGDVAQTLQPSPGGGPRVRDLQPRPPGSRALARSEARSSGMLAVLGSNPAVFDPLAEIGAFAGEPAAITDYGVPVGMGPGATWGTFGTGPGGFAAEPGGTIAGGRYATIGIPGTPGPGVQGFRGPGLDPRRPRFSGPNVNIGAAEGIGALDPSIIRGRIRSKLERIRHCYERTLLTAPELTGTVATRFLISPEGAVIQASASGMGHDGLHACVAGVIEGITFPRVNGGGLTRVTYSFELRNTGR